MVRLPAQDRRGAVELLRQHDAGELVRQRQRAEGEAQLGPRQELGREARRAADDEGRALRRALLAVAQDLRQPRGVVGAAHAVERDDRPALEVGLQPAALALLHLGHGALLEGLLLDLDDLELQGAREPRLVLGRGLQQGPAGPADDDEPEDCLVLLPLLLLVQVVVGLPLGLGQLPDALARRPLGVVVLHRVDQLAHEARREVDAGDDDARHLVVVDLVVDAREGDRELVVRVADVREVRVDAGHDLGREVDVQVPLVDLVVHRASIAVCPSGRVRQDARLRRADRRHLRHPWEPRRARGRAGGRGRTLRPGVVPGRHRRVRRQAERVRRRGARSLPRGAGGQPRPRRRGRRRRVAVLARCRPRDPLDARGAATRLRALAGRAVAGPGTGAHRPLSRLAARPGVGVRAGRRHGRGGDPRRRRRRGALRPHPRRDRGPARRPAAVGRPGLPRPRGDARRRPAGAAQPRVRRPAPRRRPAGLLPAAAARR